MKRNILTALLLMLCIFVHGQNQNYYYYFKGQPINLDLDTSKFFVGTININNFDEIRALIANNANDVEFITYDNIYGANTGLAKNAIAPPVFYGALVSMKKTLPQKEYLELLNSLKNNSSVDYVAPSFMDHGANVIITHLFRVKLKSKSDYNILEVYAEEVNCKIVGSCDNSGLWYTLSCDKYAFENILQSSCKFTQSGFFECAEPVFGGDIRDYCVTNDPGFGQQQYLSNTGLFNSGGAGMDIKACQAWDIAQHNADVNVAIVDRGIYTAHPDLSGQVVVEYDAYLNSLHHVVLSGHGTLLAGIIGATQNNNIGISGIAPQSHIQSVVIPHDGFGVGCTSYCSTDLDRDIKQAMVYATDNLHADVITIAWGRSVWSQFLLEAMEYPLSHGRNGLGTVVVVAAGNEGTSHLSIPAQYAATYDPDIITVGSTSTCWQRKWHQHVHEVHIPDIWEEDHDYYSCDDGDAWNGLCAGLNNCVDGSCYGPGLDIMAPGELAYTTQDPNPNYGDGNLYSLQSGTSLAAPQVAAVASLMLSTYPCLTQYQVGKLIDEAAMKFGYTYTSDPANSFGSWNNEVGYGLLDAQESINRILDMTELQHDHIYSNEKNCSMTHIRAGRNVTSRRTPGDYTIDNGANVEIKATKYITFEPGFEVKPGGVMNAHIEAFTGDCTNWIPILGKTSQKADTNAQVLGMAMPVPVRMDEIGSNFIVSPNPFKEKFDISYNVTSDMQDFSVNVYDLLGNIVYKYVSKEEVGYHTISVPIAASTSVYIAKMCLGNNCVTRKLIKNANN